MTTYIAILRGINVSEKNKIKMAELRVSLASLGFSHLKTYIQSGNIVFQHQETPISALEQSIHQNIMDTFGYDVPVLVRTQTDWQTAFDNNPFLAENPETDIKYLHVTFLGELPETEKITKTLAPENSTDALIFAPPATHVYVHCPNGYGRTKLNNGFFERKLKVRATTRNWKTVTKLLLMTKD
ncbi:MAG: DUF1697 domain-containing protein [Chitinophagales bacterium]